MLLAVAVGFAASFFYIYDFIARVMPAAMTHELMAAFHIRAGSLGILTSMFFYGYAPMQIPAGVLLDRLGARKVLTLATLFTTLATVGFAYTTHFEFAVFCRFVMGFMAAFAYIGALKVGAHWFKAKHFAIYASLVQIFGCVGAIIGEGPIAKLTEIYSWKTASLQIAGLGLIFTIIIFLVVRNEPPKAWSDYIGYQPEAAHSNNKRLPFWVIFKSRDLWTTALFGFAIWAPITIFAVLWGSPFFKRAYHMSSVDAASMLSLVWVGVAIGGPIVTFLSSWFHKRRLLMGIAAVIGIIASVWIIYFTPQAYGLTVILLLLFGLASSSMALCFGLVMDTQPTALIATASGFINMAIVLGGLTLQPAAGFILDFVWQGQHSQTGSAIYTLSNYHMALLVVPLAFLLAALTAIFLVRERFYHTEKSVNEIM